MSKSHDCDLIPRLTVHCIVRYWSAITGDARFCGSMQNLRVHHQQLRSHSGGDEERNLITLCAECHARLHQKRWQMQVT